MVEDEEPIRQSLAKLLRRYFRSVLVSEDGQEGLKHLHEGDSVDLVLSDIRMPKLDGFAMARAIRKEWPELPIIFLSAHNDVANLLDAIEIGVEHFIVKPIES
ncbi:MAG: response regulator [Campylobacterales bacterium]